MKKFKKIQALLLVLVLLCIPLQRAEAAEGRRLVPVGEVVGIQLETQGVVVARAEGGKIRPGDVIVEMNGKQVSSGEDIRAIAEGLEPGENVDITVLRDGKSLCISRAVTSQADGTAVMGLWLRDRISGIGTVTYYDPENGSFGALGHGITDVDCGLCLPLRSGFITESGVSAVLKGAAGAPGQLCGGLEPDKALGDLSANTTRGIFGSVNENGWSPEQAIEAAEPSETVLGAAEILSTVEGEEPQRYGVEIVRLYSGSADGRDMMLKITDPRLLEKTGGIVQGMSGSPIIQNGKLVGAVTHVLVNDPTRGYGIFIENMLDAAA